VTIPDRVTSGLTARPLAISGFWGYVLTGTTAKRLMNVVVLTELVSFAAAAAALAWSFRGRLEILDRRLLSLRAPAG